MMRTVLLIMLILGIRLGTQAQTNTPVPTPTETATPTPTNTPAPWVYATLEPVATDEAGQMTRFDYVATVGGIHLANLLTAQIVSEWVMFIFAVVVLWGRRR